MGSKNDDQTASDAEKADADVIFSSVTVVATGWMLDFTFLSLCRHFREGDLDEFNELTTTFQRLSDSSSLKGNCCKEKILISAFLARVIHGEQLDVMFETDDTLTPLMSAAKIWSSLEHIVVDETLFKEITDLLLVQSVAVSLKGGKRPTASSVLKWFRKNQECPQNLLAPLSKIVSQKDMCHSVLMSFSFPRLLETVQSFLDAYLEKNPSDYLLKAATKMVQSLSYDSRDYEDVESQERSPSKTTKTSIQQNKRRKKRKLHPTKITDLWNHDSCKKLTVSITRLTEDELPKMESDTSVNVCKKRKSREKWTPQLDKYLKDGVSRHGVGKWSFILMDYDFKGRTGTMLKDRWRVLLRTQQVG